MARIVKQLMQFARQRKAELCQTELVEVARETTSLLQPMADKRQVGLELLSSREPVLAEADSGQLQQALTNLVINAVHAAPPGTAVEVRVGRSRVQPPVGLEQPEADYAFISVTDHGTGMAPDVAGRVFEPFFTTKGVGEGAGLGLAVSFGIAREHGGWITVDTEVGRGSTFTIYIPGENSQL
jgi:two-component system NtrC family sensor kinase